MTSYREILKDMGKGINWKVETTQKLDEENAKLRAEKSQLGQKLKQRDETLEAVARKRLELRVIPRSESHPDGAYAIYRHNALVAMGPTISCVLDALKQSGDGSDSES